MVALCFFTAVWNYLRPFSDEAETCLKETNNWHAWTREIGQAELWFTRHSGKSLSGTLQNAVSALSC